MPPSCPVCNILDEVDEYHRKSTEHKFNWALLELEKKREKICKNRNGIELAVNIVPLNSYNYDFPREYDKKGCYAVTLTPSKMLSHGNRLEFECSIKNSPKGEVVYLTYGGILHPYKAYSMYDPKGNLEAHKFLQLNPGATYQTFVKLELQETIISSFKIPIYFSFQTAKNQEIFSIARSIIVGVYDEIVSQQLPTKSPFTHIEWEKQVEVVSATKRNNMSESFKIPNKYRRTLRYGLEQLKDNYEVLQEIKRKLYPNVVTSKNYSDFFSLMLWLEEMACSIGLSSYNMENVYLTYIPGDLLRLQVPGLAEKRPSVIVGDMIEIRIHEDRIAYQGVVKTVADSYVEIAFLDPVCINYVKEFPSTEMDVRFILGRLPFERMHQGVTQTSSTGFVNNLFPHESLARTTVVESLNISQNEFFNKDVYRNNEQRTAVLKILNCTSKSVPYIVYGPPGTGKTMTIVEAIMQLKRLTKKKILVCAPANAACNMIAEKLIAQGCTKSELKRVLSQTVEMESIHPDVIPYCNLVEDRDGKEVYTVLPKELEQYRIVVTTLVLAGRYTRQYRPDVVFIDEAAQAREPEACCAIGLLSADKQLVLAGDPKQLGPSINSKICLKYKFDISILERLMELPLYKTHNPNFITMLKLNFRSHQSILKISNELFYDNQLLAMSVAAKNDPIARIFVYKATLSGKNKHQSHVGQPVEFCSVLAKEKREGRSPSYYNEKEVQMVRRYVQALVSIPNANVKPSDIGVVTPYIRQVYKVREALRNDFSEVEVGTTEAFQGREKRIIIVSSVRAQEDLLLYDRKYKLGFVKNEKRFNVAITRAKSKLILIGNPMVLATDEKWLRLIEMCQQTGTFGGAQFMKRTEELREDIASRMGKLNITANNEK